MSQILSQLPRQLLQQQQRLTPQLIQAMDILQLNAMALESRIAEEIDENPALEWSPEDNGDAASGNGDAQVAEKADGEEAMVVAEGGEEDFDRLDKLVTEYDWIDDEAEYRGTKSRARLAEEGDAKLEAMANTAARGHSLEEFLLDQWSLIEIDERTRAVGAAIIDLLNDYGRLETPLEEVAASVEPAATIPEVEDALARIQLLDPPGIAARDLKECLLLQLEALPQNTDLEQQIIDEHFENLQKNRLPQIAKSIGIEVDDVKEALGIIGRLSMHPGLDVVDHTTPTVTPDVVVEYNEAEDRYETRLTRDNQRELRISPEFRRVLERAREDKNARQFLKAKIDAANAIIDALRYRRSRLLEVAEEVVAAQREFLDQGEQHLKILRMSDLADKLGCDPSTISRTVDEKWIETPRGIYALRKFFTGGTASDDGEELGWESIKAKVQEIVDSEDKSKPLSDDAIVKVLHKAGIHIKRRTVAKYRSQLAIPTARQRKQY